MDSVPCLLTEPGVLPWDKLCHPESLSLKRYLVICKWNTKFYLSILYTRPSLPEPSGQLPSIKFAFLQEKKKINRICWNSLKFWIYEHVWLKQVIDSFYVVQKGSPLLLMMIIKQCTEYENAEQLINREDGYCSLSPPDVNPLSQIKQSLLSLICMFQSWKNTS